MTDLARLRLDWLRKMNLVRDASAIINAGRPELIIVAHFDGFLEVQLGYEHEYWAFFEAEAELESDEIGGILQCYYANGALIEDFVGTSIADEQLHHVFRCHVQHEEVGVDCS